MERETLHCVVLGVGGATVVRGATVVLKCFCATTLHRFSPITERSSEVFTFPLRNIKAGLPPDVLGVHALFLQLQSALFKFDRIVHGLCGAIEDTRMLLEFRNLVF